MKRIIGNSYFIIALANSLLFIAFTGGAILIPTNIDWLMWGDSATHYLGWEFYRRGPIDVWPPGSSPLYGAGYSSSVVYSDSIPLLAIPLKYLLRGFSGSFQYLGFWIFVCFVGQGVAALRLLKALDIPQRIRVPLSLVFSLMPAFLYRMVTGGHGHIALTSHFLILIALALALQPYSARSWIIVITVSLLVHGYIFLMVAIIYISHFIRLLLRQYRSASKAHVFHLIRSGCAISFGAVSVAYIAGYFDAPKILEEGFGVFRTDVLTFIDPNTLDFSGWSRFLIDLPYNAGAYEGYAFMGAGVLLLILANFKFFITGARKLVQPLMISIIMFAFSLSNRILISGREFFVIPLPNWLLETASSVRSSGRFVWPLMYTLLCVGIAAVSELHQRHKALAISLVVAVLGIQFFDSLPAYREIRERFVESSREVSVLPSPRWDSLAANKTCLATVPVQFKGRNWIDFAELALRNDLSTNAAYLVRFDERAINEQSELLMGQIDSGNLMSDCLYVLVSDNPTSQAASISLRYRAIRDGARRNVDVVDEFVVISLE